MLKNLTNSTPLKTKINLNESTKPRNAWPSNRRAVMKDYQNTFNPIPLDDKRESTWLIFFAGIGITATLFLVYLLIDMIIKG